MIMIENNKSKTFPYSMFPVRLEHMEGKNKKICFFTHKEDMIKYVGRLKLKKKDYKFSVKSDKKKK